MGIPPRSAIGQLLRAGSRAAGSANAECAVAEVSVLCVTMKHMSVNRFTQRGGLRLQLLCGGFEPAYPILTFPHGNIISHKFPQINYISEFF